TSYFLVVTEHEKNEVRYAGLFYLVMTHIGTAFIILTFLVLFQNAESFSFEAFRQSGHTLPEWLGTVVFLAALVGFGTKAGIVPLHVWLPYAHPAAPSHVSALMSGVMIKTAIYGLIRVYFDFLGGEFTWGGGVMVLVVGTVSALLGVMYALMEHDIKRLLAYHSVENIGIILMGIGAGMIFSAYGFPELAALGIIAGLYHTINHAVFKSLLFLGSGSLLYATHTRNMEEYGGLLKRMPWTGLFFLIGAVSISALPPTNGFVSEWLIFQNLFLAYQIPDILLDILLPIAAAMLALTGGLALACFAKAFGISFLALPRGSHAKHAQEVPIPMRIGMGGLALMCLVLGLGPMLAIPFLDQVSAGFVGVSVAERVLTMDGWALTTANFASVSMPGLAIMLLVLSGVGLLIAILLGGRLKSRSYKTWGCGLNVTSRMEYTATGFAQPIKRMFSTVYQPTVKLESEMLEESRYFAKRRYFDFHITPFFQQYLYDPVVNIFLRMSHRLRNRTVVNELNLYLGYVFAALLVVLLSVR
ncbi:MAG: hydrogenase 4 subunit B, partial [Nitrospira sp.]|nr:hydrogenase 4 subunit B [Nitrospira sp.]